MKRAIKANKKELKESLKQLSLALTAVNVNIHVINEKLEKELEEQKEILLDILFGKDRNDVKYLTSIFALYENKKEIVREDYEGKSVPELIDVIQKLHVLLEKELNI